MANFIASSRTALSCKKGGFVGGSNLQVAACRLQVAGCRLLVAGYGCTGRFDYFTSVKYAITLKQSHA